MPNFNIEKSYNCDLIAGVDEAGRGPLCGPVTAAAVIIRDWKKIHGKLYEFKVNDSKRMTAPQRDAAYEFITNCPDIIWSVAECSAAEIDEINILHAAMRAMRRAIDALAIRPEFVLIDGNRLPIGITPLPCDTTSCAENAKICPVKYPKKTKVANLLDIIKNKENPATPDVSGDKIFGRAIVKGDRKSMSIACASVIAKVTRDRIMKELAAEFPQYDWEKNAGYPTPSHLNAIKIHGINEHYRKSYKPVKDIIGKDI